MTPEMLRKAGAGSHTALAVRRDEMVLDPVGTRHMTEMLALHRQRGSGGGNDLSTNVTLKLDGRVLGQVRDTRRIRALERGYDYQDRVRNDYRRS